MLPKLGWFYGLFLCSFSFAAKIDLKAAYHSALLNHESIKISGKLINQADEKVSQGWGQIVPHLTLSGSYLRQDNSNGSANSQTKPDQSQVKLTLTQPIFHGLRDVAELKIAQANERAEKSREMAQRISLYKEVSSVFYKLLSIDKEIKNLNLLLQTLSQRESELRTRNKIGRSRKSEILSNKAQLATLKAQIETVMVDLESEKRNFTLLTHLEEGIELVEEKDFHPSHSASLSLYLSLIDKRPDVVAEKEELLARSEAVSSQFGQHYPTIDLAGNYYLHRTGILANSKWDLGVTATFNLFQGGIFQSQVREAIQAREEKELRVALLRKSIEIEIRTLFGHFQSLLKQYELLQDALRFSEENYQEQAKEYRLGLVTNLDVLQALNSFHENKRQIDRTHYQIHSTYAQLEASVGQVVIGE